MKCFIDFVGISFSNLSSAHIQLPSGYYTSIKINKTINNILINRGAHTSDGHKLNMLNLFCIICTIIKWNSMRLLHCHSVLNTWLEQKRFPTAWFGFKSLFVLSPLIYDCEGYNMSEKWGKICLSISPKCHQVLCKCRLFLHKSITHFIQFFSHMICYFFCQEFVEKEKPMRNH